MAYVTRNGKLQRVGKGAMQAVPNTSGRPTLAADKGEYGGSCNITACQRPNSALWYNHSTRRFYCQECATTLNNDPFNHHDSHKLFGHDLCTLGHPDSAHHAGDPMKFVLKNVGETHITGRREELYYYASEDGQVEVAFSAGLLPFTWKMVETERPAPVALQRAVVEAFVAAGVQQHLYSEGFDEAIRELTVNTP